MIEVTEKTIDIEAVLRSKMGDKGELINNVNVSLLVYLIGFSYMENFYE